MRFSLLFCAFLLSFPRISRVLQWGQSSFFFGGSWPFCQKKQGLEGQGSVGVGAFAPLRWSSTDTRVSTNFLPLLVSASTAKDLGSKHMLIIRAPPGTWIEEPSKSTSASERNYLAWPHLQSPAVKKNFFFLQIFGGEKLLKFVEKCRWNIFKRPERG